MSSIAQPYPPNTCKNKSKPTRQKNTKKNMDKVVIVCHLLRVGQHYPTPNITETT
jgi:hypothetical protein